MISLLRFFNRCPGCGASARVYCSRCWYELHRAEEQSDLLHLITDFPFPMRAAWLWEEEPQAGGGWVSRSEIIRQSVLMAKGRPNPDLMRVWSSEIYQRAFLGGHIRTKRDWLVLVPPSVQFRGDGHAKDLARELSMLAGNEFPEFAVFERRTGLLVRGRTQKTKTRIERLESDMSLSSAMSQAVRTRVLDAPGYIFVDDVIATGSTAIAAWKALGKPRNFEAWAMVWRTCGPRGAP